MDSTVAGIDSSLAVLIALTALAGGAVAFVTQARPRGSTRALLLGGGVTLGIVAAFAALLALAHLSLIATDVLAGLLAGLVAWAILLPDLGRRRTIAAAAGITLVMAAAFLFVFHLAVMAFVGAMSLYALIRTRIRLAPALILTGTTLSGLLAAAAAVFWIGLQTM
jgi:hypothetical protein